MKRTFAIISTGLLFALSALPALAVSKSTTTVDRLATNEASRAASKVTDKVTANLQERANQELDRRLAALNQVLSIINNLKKLSSAEKSTLTTQIQSEITNLTNLKSKIVADTELDTLRTDVKSIVSSYRVFALFIPKVHLLAAADSMSMTTDNLTILATKLDSRIKDAETAGKSVTTLKATLADMQDSIADAKKQYESIITNVTPLTPDGYPGNRTTLMNARTMLTTGRKDLTTALKDARTIITSLKAFRPADNNASSSATPATDK